MDGSVSEDGGNTQFGAAEKADGRRGCLPQSSAENPHPFPTAVWPEKLCCKRQRLPQMHFCLFIKLSVHTWINWDCSWWYFPEFHSGKGISDLKQLLLRPWSGAFTVCKFSRLCGLHVEQLDGLSGMQKILCRSFADPGFSQGFVLPWTVKWSPEEANLFFFCSAEAKMS